MPYSLVWLSLEYASSIWTPITKLILWLSTAACLLYHHLTGPYHQPITMYLIKVQRRAVHLTLNNYVYHSIMWLLSCRIITNLLCIITSKELDYITVSFYNLIALPAALLTVVNPDYIIIYLRSIPYMHVPEPCNSYSYA